MYSYLNYSANKIKFILFVSTLILFIASGLFAINVRWILETETEAFLAKHNSISMPRQLLDDGTIGYSNPIGIVGALNIVKKMVLIYMNDALQLGGSSPAPTVDLFIKFKHLEKLYADRERAIGLGVLTNPQVVPCQVSINQEPYECKVRLKGDLSDHWNVQDRMSLRIKILDGYVSGMNEFSLVKPRARQYPYDQAFQELIRRIGGLSSNNQKIFNVMLNGKPWGSMIAEEVIGNVYLEARSEKVGPIFRISDQKSWAYDAKKNGWKYYYPSDPTITLSPKSSDKKYFKTEENRRLYSQLLNSLMAKDGLIFDRDKMIANFVAAMVWGSLHPLFNSNSWYYWNGYTQKLEPIVSDQDSWYRLDRKRLESLELPFEYKILFNSESITEDEIKKNLNILKGEIKNILPYINNSKSIYFPNDKLFNYNPLDSNIDFIDKNITYVVNLFNSNWSKDKRHIPDAPTVNQLKDMEDFVRVIHYNNGDVLIKNITGVDVTVREIIYRDKVVSVNKMIKASTLNALSEVRVNTPFKGNLDHEIVVSSNSLGVEKKAHNSYSIYPASRELGRDYTRYCSKVSAVSPCEISSSIEVSRDLIFNIPVIIGPGTLIKLTNGANLIFGDGLTAKGEKLIPIVIAGDNSGGVLILNKGNSSTSRLENIHFSNLAEVRTPFRSYSGSLNGYGGKFIFHNVIIQNGKSEDQINLVKTNINVDGLIIQNAPSDGLDCDFCYGSINGLSVSNVGGDGLDISGSDLSVSNLSVFSARDKGISVGERSQLILLSGALKKVGTAVAVKDGSSAVIDHINVDDVESDLFMTYIKKPFFEGSTTLRVKTYQAGKYGGDICVRGEGTDLLVQNNMCKTTKISVRDLYQGRMKK